MSHLMKHDLMRRTMVLFVGLSLVVLAGYAGAQSSPDVTGTWVGDTVRGSATMTMVLKQTGKKVSGTIVGVGTDDGHVDGTVDGNTIRLRFDNGTDETPALTIKGNEITGMLSGAAIRFRRIGA
jgi:hypothetical protein